MRKRKNSVGQARKERMSTVVEAPDKSVSAHAWKRIAAGAVAVGGFIGALLASSNSSLDILSKVTAADIDARVVKASFQEKQFDLVAVRISNPSSKGDSLTEPAFECATEDKMVTLRSVWYEPAGDSPRPNFPSGARFPLNVPPTSMIETSVLVFKAEGSPGLRDCRELRFSWVDAHQIRQHGPAVKLQPNTTAVTFSS